jgi:hypothetical protein
MNNGSDNHVNSCTEQKDMQRNKEIESEGIDPVLTSMPRAGLISMASVKR